MHRNRAPGIVRIRIPRPSFRCLNCYLGRLHKDRREQSGTRILKRLSGVSGAVLHTVLQICVSNEGQFIGSLEHQTYIHGIHSCCPNGLHAQVGILVGTAF